MTQTFNTAAEMCEFSKLDQAWAEINALGGTSFASSYDHGIFATVEKALEIIEALGGMDPKLRQPA